MDSPAQVTSRSSMISSLAVCLQDNWWLILLKKGILPSCVVVLPFIALDSTQPGWDLTQSHLHRTWHWMKKTDGCCWLKAYWWMLRQLDGCWHGSVWIGQGFSPTSWHGSAAQPGIKIRLKKFFFINCFLSGHHLHFKGIQEAVPLLDFLQLRWNF